MSLHARMSKVNSTNPYFQKDLEKASKANKFIGRGSAKSSTLKYQIAAGDLANCGVYEASDVVFVSAEGNRQGRLEVDFEEIRKAVNAKATIITDSWQDRNRLYNLGERQVAAFLEANGYSDNRTGTWKCNNSLF